jgi:hypothetical protein
MLHEFTRFVFRLLELAALVPMGTLPQVPDPAPPGSPPIATDACGGGSRHRPTQRGPGVPIPPERFATARKYPFEVQVLAQLFSTTRFVRRLTPLGTCGRQQSEWLARVLWLVDDADRIPVPRRKTWSYGRERRLATRTSSERHARRGRFLVISRLQLLERSTFGP